MGLRCASSVTEILALDLNSRRLDRPYGRVYACGLLRKTKSDDFSASSVTVFEEDEFRVVEVQSLNG